MKNTSSDRSVFVYQGIIRLEMPPPCLSKVTMISMQITNQSIIELIEMLHEKPFEYNYVLTSKFIQECLEVISRLFSNCFRT